MPAMIIGMVNVLSSLFLDSICSCSSLFFSLACLEIAASLFQLLHVLDILFFEVLLQMSFVYFLKTFI